MYFLHKTDFLQKVEEWYNSTPGPKFKSLNADEQYYAIQAYNRLFPDVPQN